MTKVEMRFTEFQTVKFRFLQVWQCFSIIVHREILFSHRLIGRNILSINEVLLSHFQLSLCLCHFKRLHICGWSNRNSIENLLVRGFIFVFIITEIEMSLPQLMLHLHIVLLDALCGSGASSGVGCLKGSSMRGFLWVANFWIPYREMGLLDLLCYLFIKFGLVLLDFTVLIVAVWEGFLWEFCKKDKKF